MARIQNNFSNNGFYGIGIVHASHDHNIGTLWRSAYIMGASFIFTVGRPYRHQTSDVTNAWTKIPLYHYNTVEELKSNLPYSTQLIAIELDDDAKPLETYQHPDRAVYILGNERNGLPAHVLSTCHDIVQLPGNHSLNVSVAGSIVLYDIVAKHGRHLP
ncbi:RNA methyltransferase [Pseudomonadota bacterium]